jgi:hypothetical protein
MAEVNKPLFQVPAQMTGFQPRKDQSYKLTFETRQLVGEEVALLADHFQQEGWLLYKPNDEIRFSDVPTETAEVGAKSNSQRLRSVIYIMWEQQGKPGSFESFYTTVTDRLIELIKSKLI